MTQYIEAKVYDQDGVFQPIKIQNSKAGELFAEWLRIHDRYTPNPDNVIGSSKD